MSSKKGFTMIELLVVLLIIGILAAVAAPMYLANTRRAKASEAVAAMSQIRQAEREYFVKHNGYRAVAAGNLANDPEATSNPGLAIDVGTPQYFAMDTYSVVVTSPTSVCGSTCWTTPGITDFLISVDGGESSACGSAPCAVKAGDVNASGDEYRLEMDNTGRIFVSYKDGVANTWAGW